jgi:hypothetical protein
LRLYSSLPFEKTGLQIDKMPCRRESAFESVKKLFPEFKNRFSSLNLLRNLFPREPGIQTL